MPKKTSPKRVLQRKKSIKELIGQYKKLLIASVVVIAGLGAYLIFFSKAATNNCQPENGIQICDVDQTAGGSDTILSTAGEAETLGGQGWGIYYGAAFRAPMAAMDGAIPVHRLYNPTFTWHEWTTDTQKSQKEALAAKGNSTANEEPQSQPFYVWVDGRHPGTVPVYRLTRGGVASQSIFTTDKGWVDKTLALDAGSPDGWRADVSMPLIAFYAFPPNYKVAGQANPYDCSILENFTSPRCAKAAENLKTAIDNGSIPKTADCPQSLSVYIKNPLSSGYSKECQDKWNAKLKDCSLIENFTSDRCKTEREALAAAQKAQIAARAAAAAAARRTSSSGGSSSSRSTGGRGGTNGSTPSSPSVPNRNPDLFGGGGVGAGPSTDPCKNLKGPAYANCTRSQGPSKGTCVVRWSMSKVLGMGSSTASDTLRDVTRAQCVARYSSRANQTQWNDFFTRKRYDFKAYWPNSSSRIL